MKKILILGASGATGSLVVEALLKRSIEVVMVVRNKSRLSEEVLKNAEVVEGEISLFSEAEMITALSGCDACISCLGHNLSFKGIFGQPRNLVTEVVSKLVRVSEQVSDTPLKFVLMGSSGVQNHSIDERPPLSQRLVVSLLRVLVPPHRDNEQAAASLFRASKENNSTLEWVVVRPDTLIDQPQVSIYHLYDSPTRNVIFNAGHTSRINVADFMSRLLTEQDLWNAWQYKMPVIYNAN